VVAEARLSPGTPRPPDPDAYYPGPGSRAHPGPASVFLASSMVAEIVAEARRALPNEACGLVLGDSPAAAGGRPRRWIPLRNALASPYRYEIDPDDLLRVTVDAEARGEEIWGIVHSHVASPARPSPTDVRQSFYPDALYVLVSFDQAEADPMTGEARLRAWRIVDATVHEVALEVGGR
jgi:proteasome lid subunit RPN8/RPN11